MAQTVLTVLTQRVANNRTMRSRDAESTVYQSALARDLLRAHREGGPIGNGGSVAHRAQRVRAQNRQQLR
jgi:hypothetical protein